MKRKNLVLVLVVLSGLATSNAFAWDGKRQGFLLGLGAGIGQLSYEGVQHDLVSTDPQEDKVSAIAFIPKLGYAFTDQLAILYSRHPFLYESTNDKDETISLTTCVEALELHYYFSSEAPSLYFGIGAGNSYLFKDDMNEPERLKGTGSMASLGYEFARHFSVDFTYTHAVPQSDATVTGMALTLSILGY